MSALGTPPEVHVVHRRLGFRSGNCEHCVPGRWHDDARAGHLRTAVIGGTPIDSRDPGERLTDSPGRTLPGTSAVRTP